jgi:hypothetical protein
MKQTKGGEIDGHRSNQKTGKHYDSDTERHYNRRAWQENHSREWIEDNQKRTKQEDEIVSVARMVGGLKKDPPLF